MDLPLLIYQTFLGIVRDELLDWCNKNYDYIGAPWVKKERDNILLKTGNGIFNTRKIKSILIS